MNSVSASSWGRVQMVALALMFAGPAILAWVMVSIGWQPGGMVNHGTLIKPPPHQEASGWQLANGEPLGAIWFTGHWSWLLPIDGNCEEACGGLLDTLRRARIALDKDASRVKVLLLQPPGGRGPPPESRFPALVRVQAPAAQINTLLSPSRSGENGAVYVVDYQGFRMMRYPLPLNGSHLLDDMERLLKVADEKVETYQQLRKHGEAPQH